MPRALLERLPYFLTIHVDVAVLCVRVLFRAAKQRKGPYLQISLTSLVSVYRPFGFLRAHEILSLFSNKKLLHNTLITKNVHQCGA